MSGYVITWNGITSTSAAPGLIVTKVSRGLLGEDRDVVVAVPGREGAWIFTERPGMRTLRLDCTVVGADASELRRASVVEVADWIDLAGQHSLIVSDQTDRYWNAKLVTPPDVDEWRLLGKFELDFIADPYAYALTESTEARALAMPSDSFVFVAADTIFAYPEVTIGVTSGSLVGFTIALNGVSLVYGGTVVPGQPVSISSLSYTVVAGTSVDVNLTGAFDGSALSMGTVSGDFGFVIPGSNTFSFNAGPGSTATGVTVLIRWRRRYR